MLQPLGISAEAEAVYVVLARHCPRPRSPNSPGSTATRPRSGSASILTSLRKLGLATDTSAGRWQALPLLDVVNHLKAQRLSEIEMASVPRPSPCRATCWPRARPRPHDDIKILVGREAIVAAHGSC